MFRARTLDDEFLPFAGNPTLMQRDLPPDRPEPVTGAGHADFVRTADGDWWSVLLAMRAYDGSYYNTGRETFLLPVEWRDRWPRTLDPGLPLPRRAERPAISDDTPDPDSLSGNFTWTDDFDDEEDALHWSRLRRVGQESQLHSTGMLNLRATDETPAGHGQPAYLARRVQHLAWKRQRPESGDPVARLVYPRTRRAFAFDQSVVQR